MAHHDSPHESARRLVDALLSERISPAAFVDGVTEIQQRLETGYAQLEAILPGDDCPEGVELVAAAAEALRAAWQGLDALRELVAAPAPARESHVAEAADGAAPPDGASDTDQDPEVASLSDLFQEAAEASLEQIRQATTAMTDLVEVTRQNAEALESAPGSLLDGMFG